ncbi:Regulation of enolase protein 1, concanavalin A-like superfamily [Singulisphaera sp. GP187]|uniref:DUF1349 domain-containing protein n=1 Tax=Singulisphaera sp. GP187 TaxID=1882752 RepID=UPI0009278FF3|nr:DUF1349 domain-containing protein [Singulisphaera sp. GP187]SIN94571.1 Regulation of enolase protein 1, concanavalin A-like superfamily [Singulisphaera sp. GP187]
MASSTSTKKRQSLSAIEEGVGRSPAAKPQLLNQLPGSLFNSPGFIMGLIAFEFLYGLFLFAVMSTNKRHRAEARAAAELYANVGPVEPPLAPKIETEAKPTPVTEPAGKTEGTPASTPEIAKVEPEASIPSKLASQTVTPSEPAPKTSTNAPRKRGNEPKAVALATPEPTPTKVEAVEKSPLALFPSLGPLIDPLQDSLLKKSDETLTIQVAAGAHIFDATRDIVDAPRALAEVEGDFTAEVKVLGDFQPGTVPLKGLFFTFQGAGLLLWQDKDNYVRFERASAYTGERLQWLYLESCKDGKLTKPKKPMNVRDGAVTLRLERRSNVINYTYSLDGKTFLKVDHIATSLPRKLSVGIAANNASPRAFAARFADFVLTPAF